MFVCVCGGGGFLLESIMWYSAVVFIVCIALHGSKAMGVVACTPAAMSIKRIFLQLFFSFQVAVVNIPPPVGLLKQKCV